MLAEAARLYAAGANAAAEATCQTIIAQQPSHFDARHLLGVVLLRQGKNIEAANVLRHAMALRPDHTLVRVNLGNALLANKAFAEALAVSDGLDAASLNNRGLAYRGLGQPADAATAFREATAIQPGYAPAWFNLAKTLAALDRLPEALEAARAALASAPPDTPVSGWRT